MIKKNLTILASAALLMSCQEKEIKPPNIILIMADDMGFSDLGCTGASVIQTPNIDYLADNGIILNQFYNASRCCPTRASLLTGHYAHTVDLGWMTASDLGEDGYRGDIHRDAPTIAEALKQSGYSTYMTGKWHVTFSKFQTQEGPKDNWPTHRGFDKFFGVLAGGGSYYIPRNLVLQDSIIEPEEDFYLTTAINNKTIDYLEQHFRDKKDAPFFFYLAHYAPHFPLHALEEDIDLYRGRFMSGWDTLRAQRYQNLLQIGLIEPQWELTPRDESVPDWHSLSDSIKEIWDAKMAVYAAQMHRMDVGIGQLIETLKKHDQLDNTIIMFLSDNGATNENIGREIDHSDITRLGDNSLYVSYRAPWANVSNVPFHLYKSFAHEGGIATPLIVHWPEKIKAKGTIVKQRGHVIDLMTTILDITNTRYPGYIRDNTTFPPQGVSLYPAFTGNPFERDALFFEHESNRAIIKGDWKLVASRYGWPWQIGEWELYNLQEDRTEVNNVIDEFPEIAEELREYWNHWAEENFVLPMDTRSWPERVNASVR